MPPFQFLTRAFDVPTAEFSLQWQNLGDLFTMLLLLGGDVISRALAQLSGTESFVTPVAFSFGWVGFAVTALLSAIGENKLMPAPDTSCQVINGHSAYARTNTSWVIGRLVRDFEHWMPAQTRQHLQHMLDARWQENREKATAARKQDPLPFTPRPIQASLCVTVLAAAAHHPALPTRDAAYLSGLATLVLQLGIAAIPYFVWGAWSVLVVTAAGTVLAAATAALPQWAREKWACRRASDKAVVLTRGNGAQHALVVLGEGRGLDFEDLAAGPANLDLSGSRGSVAAVVGLSGLWVALLVVAAAGGVVREYAGFMVAVGAVGMAQNVYVAGARRRPEAVGVPLVFREVIGETKVFETLLRVEERYPKVGRSMLDTFFPGGHLSEEERVRWRAVEEKAAQ
ncbi:hypothetical protein DBV05_g9574 [Lasiodiplodia theobromae]|uniref:Uncharacterized protein n=1 Tax=Lasiodiplodia theobromae TaxID=45133 RepID=A0A5N5D243_9PEZI|nr:hypothetical protein DBV05_g9574 [Lasiodiplodia theobromae]